MSVDGCRGHLSIWKRPRRIRVAARCRANIFDLDRRSRALACRSIRSQLECGAFFLSLVISSHDGLRTGPRRADRRREPVRSEELSLRRRGRTSRSLLEETRCPRSARRRRRRVVGRPRPRTSVEVCVAVGFRCSSRAKAKDRGPHDRNGSEARTTAPIANDFVPPSRPPPSASTGSS